MDNYTPSYLRNHCVDFFYSYNGIPIHVLTDGCLVPNCLSDVLQNRKLQHEIALAFEGNANAQGYSINQDYIRMIQHSVENMGEEYRQYVPTTEDLIESHAHLSLLGFYSYACVWDDAEETMCRFILVTSPNGEQHNVAFELPECEEQHLRLSEDFKEIVWEPYIPKE